MHRLIIFKIAFFVVLQHILGAYGQRSKATNPCPNDFLRIHNRCYYFSSEYETWERANWKCQDKNSTLAVINSKNQNDALKEFLIKGYTDAKLPFSSKLQTEVPRWIGGQYDWRASEWKWIYNGKVIRYHEFDKKKQQNTNLAWHCLIIDPTNKLYSWNSDSCFGKNYYICQTRLLYRKESPPAAPSNQIKPDNPPTAVDKPLNNSKNNSTEQHDTQPGFYVVTAGNAIPLVNKEKKKRPKRKFICPKNFVLVGKKCYYLSREKENWNNAYYKCQDIHSELAILKNLNQDRRLRFKVNKFKLSNEQRWIGGHYDWKNRAWKWATTGALLPIQPYSAVDLQWACALWDPNISDGWTSDSCVKPMHYICQASAKPADKKAPPKKANSSSKTLQTK